MKSVKVSSKGQIVIPKEIREALELKKGSEVLLELMPGASPGMSSMAVILPKPRDYVKAMRGLGAEVWRDVNVEEYIEKERGSWE